MRIRAAHPDDVASIIAIERESSTAAHWTVQQYRALLVPTPGIRRLALVAEGVGAAPAVLGFLVARHLAHEWELENIVVALSARRTGVGKRLLEGLLAAARETHSELVFLEVRESNLVARGLYEKIGFRETGRRKSYYTNPLEDAVLYSLALR
jgi:ribosomal-protein-alanine N-acetyltransferase